MFQTITIAGNLGADPESRTTGGGMTVCNLRVAVNGREKRNGEWQDITTWFRVVTFGKTAENAAKYLAKGRKVLVRGKISTGSYEKDGRTVYTWEVVADELRFLGGREESSGSGGGSYGGNSGGYGGGGYSGGNSGGAPDDDIPF